LDTSTTSSERGDSFREDKLTKQPVNSMLDRKAIEESLKVTETLDGLALGGNNHKLSHLLRLREHVVSLVTEMDKYNSDLQDLIDVQCSEGNWNYNEYMRGMANGLLVAQAARTEKVITFLEAPETFLCDLPSQTPRLLGDPE